MTASRRVMHALMAVALVWNTTGIVVGPTWWHRATSGVIVGICGLTLYFAERSHRRTERLRWTVAAATRDPLTALAQMDYTRRLPMRRFKVLMDWRVAHLDATPTVEDIATAPDVVRGWYAVAENPPREAP